MRTWAQATWLGTYYKTTEGSWLCCPLWAFPYSQGKEVMGEPVKTDDHSQILVWRGMPGETPPKVMKQGGVKRCWKGDCK